jgi:hypothetical protein
MMSILISKKLSGMVRLAMLVQELKALTPIEVIVFPSYIFGINTSVSEPFNPVISLGAPPEVTNGPRQNFYIPDGNTVVYLD